jgi:hypothetical protein
MNNSLKSPPPRACLVTFLVMMLGNGILTVFLVCSVRFDRHSLFFRADADAFVDVKQKPVLFGLRRFPDLFKVFRGNGVD